MSETMVLSILKDAIYTGLLIAAPILISAMVIGLLISIFQATTQIQEQTLTFVPKLVIIAVVGLFLGSWMMHTMSDFTTRIFNIISNITH
jgi:flagellar biosynthesis protein FliQ